MAISFPRPFRPSRRRRSSGPGSRSMAAHSPQQAVHRPESPSPAQSDRRSGLKRSPRVQPKGPFGAAGAAAPVPPHSASRSAPKRSPNPFLKSLRPPKMARRSGLDQQTWTRLITVWGVLMVSIVLLILNLLRIQVFQAATLQERAREQQMVFFSPSTPRRQIVDRNGNVLAIDEPVYTLYAHRVLFHQPPETVATAVAPLIHKPINEILEKFKQAESGVRVMDDLSEDAANRVRALQLDGLELIEQQERVYPQQDLFANVVGYVNLDRQGQAGVELSQEDQLQRSTEALHLNRSGDGSIIPINLPPDFLKTDDLRLQLTVDSRLQQATQHVLKEQVENYYARRGAVLVMDVQDGSILAMASAPSYDPNKYYEADMENLKDWVLTDLYEPGSTFKPVNVAIAIESGAVRPDDYFYDEGAITVDGWPIQNSDVASAGGRGDLSVAEILKYSSNVGMVHIMDQMQAGVYYGWLQRLGLDQPTGIDLPTEGVGQLKTYEQFTGSPIEPATTAFGQGFSLTPIKLLQLHSALANGGKLVTPHVVQGLSDPLGQLKWRSPLPSPKRVFSAHTATTVLQMMEQVVDDGTGKAAQIPGYQVAGKTGTAQKAADGGGYIEGARITSFVGIVPIKHPRYAVLAVVDEPQGEDAYGGTVAAPIVRSVMEALITTEHIPSTDAVEQMEQTIEQNEAAATVTGEPGQEDAGHSDGIADGIADGTEEP